ncbi:MAG: 50S ribosomal protein L15 [Anaerolineae bacterium]|jgi:large subunit ribosomal protein L15|nr:50S ribosomal protein L15 [Chloroflexota bacterium]
MKLSDLRQAPGAKSKRKRRGRGISAGQGKTGGFGTKGQGARSGRGGNPFFEGGQLPMVRRLARRRGFRNVNRVEYTPVNLGDLAVFEAGTVVDPEALVVAGLVRNLDLPIKVLAHGDLSHALTVRADGFSEQARTKIEAAGGTAEVLS